MVRAPCCEKTGLKKGPWTSEEDQVLINYIHLHGHGNWRALPKLAGLLRCGKSCRLRWTNYLRPDIKRGNFSREEEDTIIQLHELLGNKWSAIAAKLPGRTDNEIKNVWHTHLKKKLPKKNSATGSSEEQSSMILSDSQADPSDSEKILDSVDFPTMNAGSENTLSLPDQHSSQRAHSDMSSSFNTNDDICKVQSPDYFPKLDDDFLTEVFSGGNDETSAELPVYDLESQLQFPLDSLRASDAFSGSSDVHEGNEMAFWNELYAKAGDFFEISDF